MHRGLSQQPRVTIGMPVRNGAAHIAQAIDSYLQQSFRDFRLIVYDNASTDATTAIVREIASCDGRVSLVLHDCDIGGAMNFIIAAERVTSPLFCWAAHDDLREPRFLESLVGLLDAHPNAALACSAVRNIDPDGTPRDVRPETASLRTTTGMNSTQRLRMYLRETPGTPFYGVFRTAALHTSMPTLHELNRLAAGGPAMLGIDMIFLARFLRKHDMAMTHEPLVLFRRGGISHNLGRYGTLPKYLRQLRMYRRQMKIAATPTDCSLRDRMALARARSASFMRWMLSRDMRRMTATYIRIATPWLDSPRAWLAAQFDPALRRLRSRLAHASTSATTIVLFGAGKHTRQRWRVLQRAAGERSRIIACCDDRASECPPIDGLCIVSPDALAELKPDVLLVSSDTYERAMYHRARSIVPRGTAVWSLYDASLDASDGASTDSMNAATSESASPSAIPPVA